MPPVCTRRRLLRMTLAAPVLLAAGCVVATNNPRQGEVQAFVAQNHPQALADWVAKAKAGGMAHPAWRIAFNKRLKCARVGTQFECVALGQPCTIKQTVPRPGPDPRGPKVET